MILNQTSVTHVKQPIGKPSQSSPASGWLLHLFADHGWAARMWFLVAALAIAAAILQPFLIIAAYRTQERVVILDETGTYHLSPLLDFENATKLQTSQTLLACVALLEKNPDGFDYPDLLQKMFLPEAFNQAKAMQSQIADELKAKQIHQKVEVSRIDVLQTRNDQVLVVAFGQLIRVGLFNDEPFTETQKFQMQFVLLHNPNMAINGRFPLAVWKFQFTQSS